MGFIYLFYVITIYSIDNQIKYEKLYEAISAIKTVLLENHLNCSVLMLEERGREKDTHRINVKMTNQI